MIVSGGEPGAFARPTSDDRLVLAQLNTFALLGIDTVPVPVEVDTSPAARPKTAIAEGAPPNRPKALRPSRFSRRAIMEPPHALFRHVSEATGDRLAAIRAIRERFKLDLSQAKEVMLQAEGIATSLKEHHDRIADMFEETEQQGDNGSCSPN